MKRLLICTWILLPSAILAAEDKVRLGLHLEEGRTYGLRMVQEQSVSQTYMGEQQEIRQRLGVAYTFEVDRYLEDRTIWVTATYRDLNLRIESPMGVDEYDSQRPSEGSSELMAGFGTLSGQSIRLLVSPIGQILRIEGVDAILKRMVEAFEMPEGPAKQEMEGRIRAQFGKEALMESFGNIMAIYPEAPVAVGQSWTRRLPSNQGIPMVFENTWTLRERRGGVAWLDLVSEVTPNLQGDAVEMAGMRLRYDMAGRQQGSVELQESSGWILRGSMSLDFQGKVQVEGADMEWPMSVKSKVRFEPYAIAGDSGQDAKSAAPWNLQALDSPAGPGSAQPNLTAGPDGRVYLSWQEPAGQSETALRFSVWEGAAWSPPRTIAQGSGWFVNWADFPSMAALSEGGLAAHWLVKSARATYAYDVHIVRSSDGGASWSEPVVPHRDGTPTEHGFVSLFAEKDGLLGAVWLDGRQMAGEGHGEETSGSMTLRYAALAPTGELRDQAVLDERVCECCQTSAARTARGVVVAYRDRSQDEVRDISVLTRIAGRWSDPRPVARDNWVINGCPVNGPSVSAQGERVAVAWFSQSDEDPKVQAAFSSDGGESFGPPVRIDSGQPIGRVDVALLDDGSALVSRLEWAEGEDNPSILVRSVSPDGHVQDDLRIAASGAARSTGFPQMIRGNQVFFAWTDTSRPSQIRTARLDY